MAIASMRRCRSFLSFFLCFERGKRERERETGITFRFFFRVFIFWLFFSLLFSSRRSLSFDHTVIVVFVVMAVLLAHTHIHCKRMKEQTNESNERYFVHRIDSFDILSFFRRNLFLVPFLCALHTESAWSNGLFSFSLAVHCMYFLSSQFRAKCKALILGWDKFEWRYHPTEQSSSSASSLYSIYIRYTQGISLPQPVIKWHDRKFFISRALLHSVHTAHIAYTNRHTHTDTHTIDTELNGFFSSSPSS